MKAMIFAAGEGRRMQPLTLRTPKPLLKVRGRALIEHHLFRLSAAGFNDIVINVAYLGDQIVQTLGNGSSYGVRIEYSIESQPLETGGGIYKALPLLGEEPFALVNADIWCDYPFETLRQRTPPDAGAHLVLVPTPSYKAAGDFAVGNDARVISTQGEWTFSGISLLDPSLISTYPQARERFPLVEALHWALPQSRLSAERYHGTWVDVGTPERLEQLNNAAQPVF